MNKRYHRKVRLKRKYKLFSYVFIFFMLYSFINNYLFKKDVVQNKTDRYVFNNLLNMNSLKKSQNNDVSDAMFVVKEDNSLDPIVYLYNTHDTEAYSLVESINYKPTIVNATDYLNERINELGIKSVHEKRSMVSYLAENNLNYSSSYKASRFYLDDYVEKNPSIKYLFDIHRDSGKKEYTTLCTGDKCYAKLLFLIGLENERYQDNENYALMLSQRLNQKISGISKGILQKSGPKVNGVYNEDFSNRTILIEVGGENNTIEEVYNTLDVLSEVIVNFIKEENNGR